MSAILSGGDAGHTCNKQPKENNDEDYQSKRRDVRRGGGTVSVAIKERPILMNGEMVRAVLNGRKTQTRRLIDKLSGFGKITEFGKSDTPGYDWCFRNKRMLWNDVTHAELLAVCPWGVVGDRLYVRETLQWDDSDTSWAYKVDGSTVAGSNALNYHQHSVPSIHMPRWASRITLEITDVRVERLNEISEEDAIAEGVSTAFGRRPDTFDKHATPEGIGMRHMLKFKLLWESLYGPGSWAENPWLWVVYSQFGYG